VPAPTVGDAVAAAAGLGYPVALKTTAPHLLHRSDLGAVRLNIDDEPELRGTHAAMADRLGPGSAEHFVMQRMAPAGVACALRTIEDPLFGPVMSFGLGGVATELLDDWSHGIPPLSDSDLRDRATALAGGVAPVRRSLGVGVVSSRAGRRMRRAVGLGDRDGLLVREVRADGPAAGAGVEPGDLIVTAAGRPVTSVDDLYAALDAAADGAGVRLGLVRGESEREVDVAPVQA